MMLINVWRLLLKGMSHIKTAQIKQTLRPITGFFVLKQVTVAKATGKYLAVLKCECGVCASTT